MKRSIARLTLSVALISLISWGQSDSFIFDWYCSPNPNQYNSCNSEIVTTNGVVYAYCQAACSGGKAWDDYAEAYSLNCQFPARIGASTTRFTYQGSYTFSRGSVTSAFAPCGSAYQTRYCDPTQGTDLSNPGCSSDCSGN